MEDSGHLFEQTYRCYPLSKAERPYPESGDKILMPSSALELLVFQGITYPMMFELRNNSIGRVSYCGVLEFTAEEGTVLMPNWMMENMELQERELVVTRDARLDKGTYLKLQPHCVAFLELSDPKAVLETMLRNHTCLTTGDTIMLMHNNKKFYIDVLQTKPSWAVSIIETDCEVDFATPLDYKEPAKEKPKAEKVCENIKDHDAGVEGVKFVPFMGNSGRLDGKSSTELVASECSTLIQHKNSSSETQNNDLGRKVSSGNLVLGSSVANPSQGSRKLQEEKPSKREEQSFQPFSGKSYKLMG